MTLSGSIFLATVTAVVIAFLRDFASAQPETGRRWRSTILVAIVCAVLDLGLATAAFVADRRGDDDMAALRSDIEWLAAFVRSERERSDALSLEDKAARQVEMSQLERKLEAWRAVFAKGQAASAGDVAHVREEAGQLRRDMLATDHWRSRSAQSRAPSTAPGPRAGVGTEGKDVGASARFDETNVGQAAKESGAPISGSAVPLEPPRPFSPIVPADAQSDAPSLITPVARTSPGIAVAAKGAAHLTSTDCLAQNGLAYGPFRDGQGADAQVYPRVEQIDEDLTALRRVTARIRTYSLSDSLAEIPRLAHKHGFQVLQGIHLEPPGNDKNNAANDAQIAAALNLAHEGLVHTLVVGNETLTLAKFPKDQLISFIRRVKKAAPSGVSVTTAEMMDVWQKHVDLAEEVDYVLAHFYPFWKGQPIKNAAAGLPDAYTELQDALTTRYPNRKFPVVIGETGWPSAGKPQGSALPSPANQRLYFDEFTAAACRHSIPFYYVEAFDEEWKWNERSSDSGGPGASTNPSSAKPPLGDHTFSGRSVGSSWGLFRSDGTIKAQFENVTSWQPPPSRTEREIFAGPKLGAFYDVGVDSSHKQRQWLAIRDGEMRMVYAPNQEWGAVFVTVREPTDRNRSWKDFSEFRFLKLELKGETGSETVEVGIKHRTAPDDGTEPKVKLTKVGTTYRPYSFPLGRFASPRFRVPEDLNGLYVVVEFVFTGPKAQTVYARNIRYSQTEK